ncbi:uncharacterized, partial [Tachysurus ichikawai]
LDVSQTAGIKDKSEHQVPKVKAVTAVNRECSEEEQCQLLVRLSKAARVNTFSMEALSRGRSINKEKNYAQSSQSHLIWSQKVMRKMLRSHLDKQVEQLMMHKLELQVDSSQVY